MTDRDRGVSMLAHNSATPIAGAPTVAAVLLIAAVLSTASGVALAVAGGAGATELPLPLVSIALGLGTAAALLLRRRIEIISVVCATAAIGGGITVLVTGIGMHTDTTPTWALVAGTAWMPGALIAASVLGIAVISARRRLVVLGIAASVVLWAATIADLVVPGTGMLATTAGWIWAAVAVIGGAALTWAWWRRSGSDRDAAGWLALAQWAVLVSAVPSYAGLIGGADAATALAATILPGAVVLLAAVLLLTGLTRDGVPVDVSLARIVFWVLLGVALVVGFVAIATAVAEVAPVTPTTAGMFAVAGLALAIEPARRWVRRAVDQLAYGRSAEPGVLLRALGDELSTFAGDAASSSGEVMGSIARALRASLRLASVEIASAQPDGVFAAAGTRAPAGRVLSVVLPGPDGAAGTLVVTGPIGSAVDRRTRGVLRSISGVLALAVRLADANREIDRARAQVLGMASQEHRLVRSELVDGVAAGVHSARLRVGDARSRAAEDPRDARRLLVDASRSLSDVTREVRDLARTLLPGALDAGDAEGALADLAARFPRPVIVIDVERLAADADPTGMALAYHLLAEAVLGARRDPGIDALRMLVTVDDVATRMRVRIEGATDAAERAGARLVLRARDAGAAVAPVIRSADAVEVELAVTP